METGGRSDGRPEVGNSTGGTFTRSFLPSLNLSDAGLEPAQLPSVPAGLNIWLVQEWLKVTIPCKPSQRGGGGLRFHRELVSTAKVVGFDKNAMAFSINGTLRKGLFRHTRPNFGRFLGVGTGKCKFKLFCKARPFGVCALVSKLLVNQVSVKTRRQGPNWHCAENVAHTKNSRKQRVGIELKIRPGSAFNKMRRKGRVGQDVGIPGGILACRF